jgi:hypothetical protein
MPRASAASDRLGDHRAQIPLSQHDQLMLVQPATCKLQQSLPIGGARELIAKDPHECATSWFAEPVKSQPNYDHFGRKDFIPSRA